MEKSVSVSHIFQRQYLCYSTKTSAANENTLVFSSAWYYNKITHIRINTTTKRGTTMKTWKRTSAGLMAFAMLFTACPALNANAENETEKKFGALTYEKDSVDDLIVITDFDESVTEVVIPAEIDGLPVLGIDEYAFDNSPNLTSVTISDGIISIGSGAFENCTGLTEITIPGSVFGISGSAFADCTGLKTVTLEEGVQALEDNAFSGCTCLTDITIPDSMLSVGEEVFTNTPLLDIKPGEICYVSDWIIDCDEAATDFTIKDGTKGIAAYAFENCVNLTDISIPDSVTAVCMGAFYQTPLLTNQEDSLFYADNWLIGCDRTSSDFTIREGTKGLAEGVLVFSEIENLVLPESLEHIGMMSVAGTGIESLIIPGSIKKLGLMSFSLSPLLEKVTIGDGVETIPVMTFTGCESLKSIHIPKSVKNIGAAAFMGCTSLTDIYYDGTQAEWNAIRCGLFLDEFTNATIHFASDAQPTCSLGDLDADGSVNANDAAILLTAAAASGAGGDSGLSEAQIKAADLNSDNTFDALDAAIILQYAAYAGAGGKDSIEDFVKSL